MPRPDLQQSAAPPLHSSLLRLRVVVLLSLCVYVRYVNGRHNERACMLCGAATAALHWSKRRRQGQTAAALLLKRTAL